jgi:hypothetical protein
MEILFLGKELSDGVQCVARHGGSSMKEGVRFIADATFPLLLSSPLASLGLFAVASLRAFP